MTSYVVGVGDEVLLACIVILILVYCLYHVLVQFIPNDQGAAVNNHSGKANMRYQSQSKVVKVTL